MGAICGIPLQSQPEHKVNITLNIPEIVKNLEKDLTEKVVKEVEEVKENIVPVKSIESYLKTNELFHI